MVTPTPRWVWYGLGVVVAVHGASVAIVAPSMFVVGVAATVATVATVPFWVRAVARGVVGIEPLPQSCDVVPQVLVRRLLARVAIGALVVGLVPLVAFFVVCIVGGYLLAGACTSNQNCNQTDGGGNG